MRWWNRVSSLRLTSDIQHVDFHIDAAIFLTVVAGLVISIREVAADAQFTDRTQRNVVLHGKVVHYGISALAAEVAIIGYIASSIGKTFHLNHIALHAGKFLNGVIQLRLFILAQNALAETKIDRRRADQLIVVQVLDGGIQLGSRLLSQSIRGLRLLSSWAAAVLA